MTSLPSAIANPALASAEFKSVTTLNKKDSDRDKEKEENATPENGKTKGKSNEQFLLQAFHSFAEAADSLERSYGSLRSEVARLHGELAHSNAGLARSLEENRQMRLHLDRILDGLPCGVLVAKSDGAISLVNPEGRRLLGAAIASWSVVPAELRDLLDRARSGAGEQEQCFADGAGGERWLAARHAVVEDGDGVNETGVVVSPENVHDKDMRGHDVRDNDMPCENVAHGNLVHEKDRVSIFILRDVSEAKRMVREREKLRREQALAEMSAILAHEIRNPLGSLELFAGLLAEAGLSAECQQWVEHVQAGLRTLAATVNNVLHFNSLPAPERVPTDLGRLLDWAGGFLVPMAHRGRVELCLRNRLQGVWFAADRHRLEQVMLNLVLNALRAMPGGGWVEIAGHRIHDGDASAAEISVTDTGPGILPGQAAKIFEPGFSTRSGGPGLGLAVCRKIVEQHGGSLAAANRAAGAGASFTLTFPLGEQVSRNDFREEVVG
jgi:two-component system sensor histidine kinase FlrB